MNTLFIGKNFVELPRVDSTNSFAAGLLDTGVPEGTVISAREQFAGRGQQGSPWLAEPGTNLALSIILYPHFLLPSQVFGLSKAVACALRDTVQHFVPGEEVLIKWPNDILLNKRKTAGILIENQLATSKVSSSIIGIGLNVNQVRFEDEGYGQPTSLHLEAGWAFQLEAVRDHLLAQLERRYMALRNSNWDGLEREYLHRLYGYQEDIEAVIDGELQKVVLIGVDTHGRLGVNVGGRLRYFGLKEISFPL